MKKNLACLLAALLLVALAGGCGGTADTDVPQDGDGIQTEPIVLKLSHNAADGQAISDACIQMADAIYEQTDGRVKIDLYGNNILGAETETRDMLAEGTIDMAAIGYGSLSSYSSVCDLLISMYLFESTDEMMAVMKGEFGQKYFNDAFLETKGVRVLDQWATVPRETISTKPIHTLDDFKGLKVRIPTGIAIWQDSWEALGAMVISQGLGECFTSMQQGVVDAVEMSVDFIYSYKFQELAKYLTYTNHSMYTQVVMINENSWNKITPEDQAIMISAVEEAGLACQARQESDEASLAEDMENTYGVQVSELSADVLAEMQALAEQTRQEYMDVWGTEAYEDLMAAISAYRA